MSEVTREQAIRDEVIEELVNKFLAWPLPSSVCSDLCATKQGYPHRSGTNLLSATETKQMLAYLFTDPFDALQQRLAAVEKALNEKADDLYKAHDAAKHLRLQLAAVERWIIGQGMYCAVSITGDPDDIEENPPNLEQCQQAIVECIKLGEAAHNRANNLEAQLQARDETIAELTKELSQWKPK